jgi:hypothetical protein
MTAKAKPRNHAKQADEQAQEQTEPLTAAEIRQLRTLLGRVRVKALASSKGPSAYREPTAKDYETVARLKRRRGWK